MQDDTRSLDGGDDRQWQKVDDIVYECLARPDDEREAALAAACTAHPEIAERIRRCWTRVKTLLEDPVVEDHPREFGDFRLQGVLGRGGMGVVYDAVQISLDRPVALKLIRQDLLQSDRALGRFRTEALAASQLDHPGVCPVYGVGDVDGIPFLAMRRLRGRTLAQEIQERRERREQTGTPERLDRTAQDRLLRLFAEACRALHAAHDAGLVHRDVKPANIFITEDDQAVLLDFGLARDAESGAGLTRSGDLLGTPAYMAPEQVRPRHGATVDRRTDVYGIGASLWEAWTLRLPFTGASEAELYEQITRGVVSTSPDAGLPHDVETVARKAMDIEPRRRYQDCRQLAADLERIRRFETVLGTRPGPALRTRRWIHRNPVVAAVLAGVTVALAITVVLLAEVSAAREAAVAESLRSTSRLQEDNDQTRALLLGVDALRRESSTASRQQVNRALHAHRQVWSHDLDATIWGVEYSPDGRRFLAHTHTRCTVFDASSFEVVGDLALTDRFLVTARFQPADGTVLLVTRPTGQQLREKGWSPVGWSSVGSWRPGDGAATYGIDRHPAPLLDARLVAGGTEIVTADQAGFVGRWRLDGTPVVPFPAAKVQPFVFKGKPRPPRAFGVVGLHDEKLLVGGRFHAAIFDGEGSQVAVLTTPESYPLPVEECRYLERVGGRTLVSGQSRSALFDAKNRFVDLPLPRGGSRSNRATLSADGRWLAMAFATREIRIFDLDTELAPGVPAYADGQLESSIPLASRFSPDGSLLAVIGADFAIHMLDRSGHTLFRLRGHGKDIPSTSIAFAPDGHRLLTADGVGELRLWDTRIRRADPAVFQQKGTAFRGMIPTETDSVVLLHDTTGRVHRWEITQDDVDVLCQNGDQMLDDAVMSPDGRRLLTGSRKGIAQLVDTDSGELLWERSITAPGGVSGVGFVDDGARVLLSNGRGASGSPLVIQLWSLEAGAAAPLEEWPRPPSSGLLRWNHLSVSRDGRWVAAAGAGRATGAAVLYRFDGGDLEEVAFLPHPGRVVQVRHSPSGDRVVTCCTDGVGRVFRSNDGAQLAALSGPAGQLVAVRWSSDGTRIVGGSPDGTAWIWHAATGEVIASFEVGDASQVWDVSLSADGRRLRTLSMDGRLREWLLEDEDLWSKAAERLRHLPADAAERVEFPEVFEELRQR